LGIVNAHFVSFRAERSGVEKSCSFDAAQDRFNRSPLGSGLGLGLGNGHAYAATGAVLGSIGVAALTVGGAVLLVLGIKKLAASKKKSKTK